MAAAHRNRTIAPFLRQRWCSRSWSGRLYRRYAIPAILCVLAVCTHQSGAFRQRATELLDTNETRQDDPDALVAEFGVSVVENSTATDKPKRSVRATAKVTNSKLGVASEDGQQLASWDIMSVALDIEAAKMDSSWRLGTCCKCAGNDGTSWSRSGHCSLCTTGVILSIAAPEQCQPSNALFFGRHKCKDLCKDVFNSAYSTHPQCAYVSGCEEEICSGGRTTMKLCTRMLGRLVSLKDSILKVYQEKKRLSVVVVDAVTRIMTAYYGKHASPPDAFSPILCPSRHLANEAQAMEEISMAMGDITAGVVPHNAGKNSRSGASFFFSRNRRYIVKQVRDFEWDVLRTLNEPPNCNYSRQLATPGSLLNQMLLAFQTTSPTQYWIVMKAESIPDEIQELLPATNSSWRESFFVDLKPAPLTSDTTDFQETLLQRTRLNRIRFGSYDFFGSLMKRLSKDVRYLEKENLIDYSLLMYGAFLDFDGDDPESRAFFGDDQPLATRSPPVRSKKIDQLRAAVEAQPNCAFGCSSRPRKLVDVTTRINSRTHLLVHGGESYKCCCAGIWEGDSELVKSPCALMSTANQTFSLFRHRAGCGNLVADGYHSYHRRTSVPHLGGKCLVALETFRDRTSLSSAVPAILAPEDLEGVSALATEPRVASCGVVCVRAIDYLLPFTTRNSIENVALVPYYGERKWTDYRARVESLMWCLGVEPPVRVQEWLWPMGLPLPDLLRIPLPDLLRKPYFDTEFLDVAGMVKTLARLPVSCEAVVVDERSQGPNLDADVINRLIQQVLPPLELPSH